MEPFDSLLENRIYGCLVGGLIGDAMGAPAEGKTFAQIYETFGPTGITDVEDMLKQNGGEYSKKADWQPYVLTDGLLITGQNPQSSELAAKALLTLLKSRSGNDIKD